jgi:nucleotide-binding universal stress UspA family protein
MKDGVTRAAASLLRPVEVRVPVQPLVRFAELMDPAAGEGWCAAIRSAREALSSRVVWHVNSTARGGGVAEMMGPLIGYARDAGVDLIVVGAGSGRTPGLMPGEFVHHLLEHAPCSVLVVRPVRHGRGSGAGRAGAAMGSPEA